MSGEPKDIIDVPRISINNTYRTSLPPVPLPPFECLPPELRQQIYRYLLVSDFVKEDSPNLEAATYSFQPAILATSRAIAWEARPFLDKNIFVVVATTYKGIFDKLELEAVPIVSSGPSAALFLDPLLRVELKFPTFECGPSQVFLMVVEDLLRLCRFIRIQSLILPDSIKVRLDLRKSTTHHEPTLSNQKLLLEPFKKAYVGMVHVEIVGPVDALYRKEILTIIKPDKLNTSAEIWLIYQLCKEIKQEGDVAFQLGKWKFAAGRYLVSMTLVGSYYQTFLKSLLYVAEWTKWLGLVAGLTLRMTFNQLLFNIKCKNFDISLVNNLISLFQTMDRVIKTLLPQTMDRSINVSRLSRSDEARIHHYCGLTFAELGRNEQANERFVEALRLSPEDLAIQESFETVKNSQNGLKHEGISQRVLGDPIVEEGRESDAEMELRTRQKMLEDMRHR